MTRPARPHAPGLLVTCVATALLAGCASAGGGLTGEAADYGSPNARMAIERFLAGVTADDYQAMGQQFGTPDGPAEDRLGINEVEKRMMYLAGVLEHRDYDLREADLARTGPGRIRYVVTLVREEEGRVDVPFVTAVSGDDRWFVEQIELDPLTRDR